jgi:hypothetical protein
VRGTPEIDGGGGEKEGDGIGGGSSSSEARGGNVSGEQCDGEGSDGHFSQGATAAEGLPASAQERTGNGDAGSKGEASSLKAPAAAVDDNEGDKASACGHAKCADDPSPSTTQLQSMTSSPATNGAAVESRDGEMAGDDGEEEEDVQRRSGSLPPSGDDEAGQGEKAGGETAFVILSPRGFEFTGDERRVDFNGKQIPAQELMLRVKEIEPWLQDEVLVLLEQDSSEPRESFSSGETVIVERGSSEQLQRVNASHGIDGQRVSSNRHVVDAAGALTNSGNGLSEDRVVPAPQQCQDGNDVGRIEGAEGEGEGERERAVQANPSNPVRVFTIFVNLDLVCLSNINQS